jgi:hypothetical protein
MSEKDNIRSDVNLIIPINPELKEDFEQIEAKLKFILEQRYSISLPHKWMAATIATVYFECMVQYLGGKVTTSDDENANNVNFNDLFTIIVTTRYNKDAEKEGNINIAFETGTESLRCVREAFEKALLTKAPANFLIIPTDPVMHKDLLYIDKYAKRTLASNKYRYIIPNEWVATTIATAFLEETIRTLIEKMNLEGKSAISFNFNDVFEIHIANADDDDPDTNSIENGIKVKYKTGVGAKMSIKNDNATETEDLDDMEEDE